MHANSRASGPGSLDTADCRRRSAADSPTAVQPIKLIRLNRRNSRQDTERNETSECLLSCSSATGNRQRYGLIGAKAVCAAGTIWDSQPVTPNDIELHRVTLSDCCAWHRPRILLICKALTTVSHDRGHRFKPCTAQHQIKRLGHFIISLRHTYGTRNG
jgi:hypothetical protein